MLSKARISFIKNLHQKKYRKEHGLFVAEGAKVVQELVNSNIVVRQLFFTEAFRNQQPELLSAAGRLTECVQVTAKELMQVTALTTPQDVMAVAVIPEAQVDIKVAGKELVLMLDDVSDPGNLGTIIRVADWFGIKNIVCSANTVDAYNPKVVQATMGSLFRVNICYVDLESLLKENAATSKAPVYGALLQGENIYTASLHNYGFILLGNESTGIDKKLQSFISTSLTIPPGSKNNLSHPDSLNVAVSAAIICSEFNRRVG
jgi:TrmH family RNA methyltransferase